MDFPRQCGPIACVDEASPDTNVVLDEGGRLTTLDVAWFDYWACSTFAGFVFKPAGVEFDGHSPPAIGRMFVVDEPLDWYLVQPGQVSTLGYVGPDGEVPGYGTVEIMDIERTPVGRPISVVGTVTAGDASWSVEGTFRATRCGNGWGPGFPCE